MTESAYSINEWADQHCAEPAHSNLVKVRDRPDETSLPQTNPILKASSRNQRQLIADKGSFDGGVVSVGKTTVRFDALAQIASAVKWLISGITGGSARKRVPRLPTSPNVTFRTALPERRINVDRVSFRNGVVTIRDRVMAGRVASGGHREAAAQLQTPELSVTFTKADSYSRCFLRSDRNSLTRLHGLQVKYRPDSQNMRLNMATPVSSGAVVSSPNRVGRCLIDSVVHFWQKPGIGIARGYAEKGVSYKFKRPDPLTSRAFSGSGFCRFQAQVDYTPFPAPKINQTAFQRENTPICIARRGACQPKKAGVGIGCRQPPDKRAGVTSIISEIKGTSGFNAMTENARYSLS